MGNGICINNIPVTWEESRLFDMYRRYLNGFAERSAFIDHNKYDHFDRAKDLYNKIKRSSLKQLKNVVISGTLKQRL